MNGFVGAVVWIGWLVNVHTLLTADMTYVESLLRFAGCLFMLLGTFLGYADLLARL